MRETAFRAWLTANKYKLSTVATYVPAARQIEDAYGDLDVIFDTEEIEKVVAELRYTTQDEKAGKSNPSKIPTGKALYANLGAFRSSLRSYAKFRETESEFVSELAMEVAESTIKEKREGKQFELERHLQEELRSEIEQLEAGLQIIDGGIERSVASGFIDILARDRSGALVVIELKAGMAGRDAVGQITGYMGDLINEEPETAVRGLLVAADFHKSCRSGVRAVPALGLKRYRFSFIFEGV